MAAPVRYHINPVTGLPGACRATRRCPFGDLLTQHYDSAEEASKAFETSMEETLVKVHKREDDPLKSLAEEGSRLVRARIEALPLGSDARNALVWSLKTVEAAVTQEEKSWVMWKLDAAAQNAAQLKREDLKEVYTWAAAALGQNATLAWDKGMMVRHHEAVQELKKELAQFSEGKSLSSRKSFRQVERELALAEQLYASTQASFNRSMKSQKEFLAHLTEKVFVEKKHELSTGDRAYDGVNEFVFVTPEGQEHTVREELLHTPHKYAGRMNLAQSEALKTVEAHGQELVSLLSRKGVFTLPPPQVPLAPGEANGEATVEQAGAPSLEGTGFDLLASGNENNVYLHKPTQMVYKVPHAKSFLLPKAFDNEQAKALPLVKRAVYLTESKYASLEDAREEVENEGEFPVEYLKTYFIASSDPKGNKIPLVVQPRMDAEVQSGLETTDVENSRGTVLYSYLQAKGFSDLHSENVAYNYSTGKIILFDCVFVGRTAREEDYAREGLL